MKASQIEVGEIQSRMGVAAQSIRLVPSVTASQVQNNEQPLKLHRVSRRNSVGSSQPSGITKTNSENHMKYADLTKEFKKLKAIGELEEKNLNGGYSDEYWDAHEAFKQNVGLALSEPMLLKKMTGRQLIQFLAWCSSFRPRQPHAILGAFSMLNELLTAQDALPH